MIEPTKSSHFAPKDRHTITPRIVVHDAKQLVEFLKQVFSAAGEYRQDLPSEVRIGDSVIMISGAGIRGPMTDVAQLTTLATKFIDVCLCCRVLLPR
jgi:uncharacterized glyoxalase superfamily protein PhnB